MAEGWGRWAPTFDAATATLDRELLDSAGILPGSRVADLACGTGEPAFGAARRVGPEGRVLAVDPAPGMLRIARIRALAQHLPWLEFVQGSAETIAERGPVHDAALCRFGAMHFDDPTSVLGLLRGGLAGGARLACAVWGAPEEVPFLQTARDVALRHELIDPPAPSVHEGPFRFASTADAEQLLAAAGFRDIGVRTTSVPMRFDSPTDYTRFLLDVSQVVRDAVESASPSRRDRFLSDLAEAALGHTGADHGLCFVNTAHVVHGTAP